MTTPLVAMLAAIAAGALAWTEAGAAASSPEAVNPMQNLAHLNNFDVVELRRYTIKAGERDNFALYFENYFPEAFQQMGAMVFGQFAQRDNPDGFVWLRGFASTDARATICAAFYYGPLWKEHKATMNDRLIDHTNVLLLRPLDRGRAIPVLPGADPIKEASHAKGIVVAQIFPLKPGSADAFARQAEASFARYRAAGARDAGVLVTLDVPNNFPQLPFRTDGPYLVWLGIIRDNAALETQFKPALERATAALAAGDFLRGAPELIFMDPTPRSRLRWH